MMRDKFTETVQFVLGAGLYSTGVIVILRGLSLMDQRLAIVVGGVFLLLGGIKILNQIK